MQMPILTYPHFSQFLHLHQQHQLQKQYSRGAQSETSNDSPSSSPSPPPSSLEVKTVPGKSFTIDAILGLREDTAQDGIFHPAFHPRLQVPDLSRLSGVLGGGDNTGAYCSSKSSDKGDSNKKFSGKSKRVRTIFTPEQLERLEAEFERQQYMVGPERLYLAHTLQLTEAQVKVWFQNRRIKWRKQHLELQQQRLAVLKQRQRVEPEESGDSDDSSPGKCANPPGKFDPSGGNFDATSGKFAYPGKEGVAPSDQKLPLALRASYRFDDNQSSRESLTNQCDDDFL